MNTSLQSANHGDSITLSGSLSELMTIPVLRTNFFAIVTQITICNFCFFFLVFILKSLKGNMVTNTLISYITQIVANAFCAPIYSYLGPTKGFTLCYAVSTVGIVAMIFNFDNQDVVPIFLCLAVLGNTCAFGLSFITHTYLTPTLLSASSFGLANVIARFFGIFAPQVAEIDFPAPEIMFIVLQVVAFVSCQLIETKLPKFN